MKCANCQAELQAFDKFCGSCGAASAGKGAPRLNWTVLMITALLFAVLAVFVQNFFIHRSLVDVVRTNRGIVMALSQAIAGSSTKPSAAVKPTSREEQLLFSALMSPCDGFTKSMLESSCKDATNGKLQIQTMLKDGQGKKEIFSYFINKYGAQVLSEQARTIYQANRAN